MNGIEALYKAYKNPGLKVRDRDFKKNKFVVYCKSDQLFMLCDTDWPNDNEIFTLHQYLCQENISSWEIVEETTEEKTNSVLFNEAYKAYMYDDKEVRSCVTKRLFYRDLEPFSNYYSSFLQLFRHEIDGKWIIYDKKQW